MFQQLRSAATGYRSRRQNRRSQYETKSHRAIAFVNFMGTVQKVQLRTIRPSELQTIDRVSLESYLPGSKSGLILRAVRELYAAGWSVDGATAKSIQVKHRFPRFRVSRI